MYACMFVRNDGPYPPGVRRCATIGVNMQKSNERPKQDPSRTGPSLARLMPGGCRIRSCASTCIRVLSMGFIPWGLVIDSHIHQQHRQPVIQTAAH